MLVRRGKVMAKIRWGLRWLFVGLMFTGLLWIQLSNWIQLGLSPLRWAREDPMGMLITYAGTLLMGLALDALDGRLLRPVFATLARLEAGEAIPREQLQRSASLAINFPARAAMALVGLGLLGVIAFHTNEALLAENDRDPRFWLGVYGTALHEISLVLLLAVLLHTVGSRVLYGAIAAHELRTVPPGRRLTISGQFLLVLLLQAAMFTTIYVAAVIPPVIPTERLVLTYLVLATVTVLMGYLVSASTGRELSTMAARIRALAGGVRPDLFDPQPVTSRDEVGELAEAIDLLQARVEHEFRTIERDLQAARTIQTELLPRPGRYPGGWDLAARLVPAQEVGGDFYDVIGLGDGRLGIAVGDSAGKGLPAALLMASTVSLLRSHASRYQSPGEVLAAVNRRLCSSIPPATFVTAVYATLNLETREIVLASGGHPSPLLGGREVEASGALPLGVDPDTVYPNQHYRLEPGESLALFSDGLLEVCNAQRQHLGVAGLAETLAYHNGGADELADALMARAAEHSQGAPQDDDRTVLVLRAPRELRLELPSRQGSELVVAREAATFARAYGPADRVDEIATAVAEGCLNGVTHGNREQAEIPVVLTLRAGPGGLEALIGDTGPLFTPPAAPPDLHQQMAGERPIRGWGFHLIRSLADEVYLEPLATGKQLRLRFYSRGDAK